jgi:hypothetical protein
VTPVYEEWRNKGMGKNDLPAFTVSISTFIASSKAEVASPSKDQWTRDKMCIVAPSSTID